jgi:hypothetical protein
MITAAVADTWTPGGDLTVNRTGLGATRLTARAELPRLMA